MVQPLENESNRHEEFVRLFVGNERRIYGFIRTLIPHRADAENVLQETAVVLWAKFDEFEPGTDFLAWSLAIARFKVLDYRKQRKRDALTFSEELLTSLEPVALEVAQQSLDLRSALELCLRKLKQADRELFIRRHVPGLSVRKLAEQMQKPATTLYSALERIQRSLVACVERQLNVEGRK